MKPQTMPAVQPIEVRLYGVERLGNEERVISVSEYLIGWIVEEGRGVQA